MHRGAEGRGTRDWAGSLMADLRFTWRQCRRRPGFVVATTAILAFGIGASVAMFSIVNPVLLEDLPYRDPNRLVVIWNQLRARDMTRALVSGPDFLDYRTQAPQFDGIAGVWSGTTTLTGGDRPLHVTEVKVTENILEVLGVRVAVGRAFRAGEGSSMDFTRVFEPGAERTSGAVIVSHGLWQRAFGGDSAVVGRTIRIDGVPAEIVGVLPADFEILLPPETGIPTRVDVWEAFRSADLFTNPRGARWLTVIGRLAPGVTVAQAQTALDALAARHREEFAEHAGAGTHIEVAPLHADVVREARPILAALLGAVTFVFLIACANAAGLFLVRGFARTTEIAVRASLGGTRGRLIRQLLTESLVLAALGAAGGVALARVGIDSLLLLQPDMIPLVRDVTIDLRLLAVTAGLALVAAAVFGLLPALQLTRVPLATTLRGRDPTGAPGGQRLRGTLTVVQVALSVVLLTGATLMGRSLLVLRQTEPGFDPTRVVTATVSPPQFDYPTGADRARFFRELVPALQAAPSADAVGGAVSVPLDEQAGMAGGRYLLEGEDVARWDVNRAMYRPVLPGFFETMRMRRVAGRSLTPDDLRADASPVVVVDRAFAERAWPGESAIGRRLQVRRFDAAARQFLPLSVAVVGVVETIHYESLAALGNGAIYATPVVWPWLEEMTIAVRTRSDATRTIEEIRAAVAAVDPNVPVSDARTMNSYLERAVAPTRFVLNLLGIFATGAVLLAAIGLYTVVAFTVRQRSREIGIRIAIGATRDAVLRLVVGRGLVLAGVGIGAGLLGALTVGNVLRAQLVGVSPADPITLVVVVLLMTVITLSASWLPALRATRIDPITSLREE